MPSTGQDQEQVTSKTGAGVAQVPDPIRSESEERTQTRETIGQSTERKVTGTLNVTFYEGQHFDVDVTGTVQEARVERSLASIYRTIGNTRVAARRKAAADVKKHEAAEAAQTA